ncbi:hypothetical protein PROFUN_15494, partial [Planoprotostelium fungivorum]
MSSPCPICSMTISDERLEQHVNECLDSSFEENPIQKKPRLEEEKSNEKEADEVNEDEVAEFAEQDIESERSLLEEFKRRREQEEEDRRIAAIIASEKKEEEVAKPSEAVKVIAITSREVMDRAEAVSAEVSRKSIHEEGSEEWFEEQRRAQQKVREEDEAFVKKMLEEEKKKEQEAIEEDYKKTLELFKEEVKAESDEALARLIEEKEQLSKKLEELKGRHVRAELSLNDIEYPDYWQKEQDTDCQLFEVSAETE